MNEIKEFKGEYYFLSNYFEAPVVFGGIKYCNTEAAFHAQKVGENTHLMQQFSNLSPDKAKKLGRSIPLRTDWEDVKDRYMYEIVKAKFIQHPELKDKLLATGTATLIEGNNWNDKYWGVCNGKGKNKLGEILMRIREELS